MRVLLPDDTQLELADGATGADAAAAIGAGPGARGARGQGRRRAARPRARRCPTARRLEIVTAAQRRRRARAASATTPPTCSPTAVLELYPGVKISIGPPIEDGFYYDFEFPDGVDDLRGRLRAHRGSRCASTSRPTSRSSARTCRSREALERFRARGPALQGRADRGPRPRPGRRDRLALHATARSPTSAAARTRPAPSAIKAFKLTVGRRRLLARRREAHRCSRASTAPRSSPRRSSSEHLERARAGARARPPQARPRARPLHVLDRRARARRSGCRSGTRVYNELVALIARA